jgi:NAD(P)-dependent dehydrogenase (short-subunit alcohol dehydrogenase family)
LVSARGLLEHGLEGLALLDINIEQSKVKIDDLLWRFRDRKIILKRVSVMDEVGVFAAVEEVAKELGSVNMLLNFAGVVGCVEATDMTPNEFRRVVEVNATGAWLCCQAVGKSVL